VLPSSQSSPQPKQQIDRFSRFCTAHSRKSLYLTVGAPFPKIAPTIKGSGPSSNTWCLGPIQAHNRNCISIGSAVFAQTTQSVPILYNGTPLPLKIVPSYAGSGPPSSTWFSGRTRVLNPNGISIGSAVFAGLTSVTDRQTDRPRYLAGNNMPHLCT